MSVEDADSAGDAASVVEFRLGDELCAVDVDAVDGVVEAGQVTRVPRTPDAVEGVMDLRGETTAVVDPREVLAVGGEAASESVLVLDREDGQKTGLRVAEVTEVAGYAEFQVERGDSVARVGTEATDTDFVKGVIRKGATREDGDTDEDAASDDGGSAANGDSEAAGPPADGPSERDSGGGVELVLWLDADRLVRSVAGGDNGDNQR